MGVQKLVITGGWVRTKYEEAWAIRQRLMRRKVPRDNLFLDVESATTKENAIGSKYVLHIDTMNRDSLEKRHLSPTLEEMLQDIKTIAVVAISFSSRRAVMTDKRWLSCLPHGCEEDEAGNNIPKFKIRYFPFPYEPGDMFNSERQLTLKGNARVDDEILKINEYSERNDIVELEQEVDAFT
jgi:hypothetical protein